MKRSRFFAPIAARFVSAISAVSNLARAAAVIKNGVCEANASCRADTLPSKCRKVSCHSANERSASSAGCSGSSVSISLRNNPLASSRSFGWRRTSALTSATGTGLMVSA